MQWIKALLTAALLHYIHKDFHEAAARMTLIDCFLFLIVHSIDKLGIWPRLPVFVGLFYLGIRQHLHQEYNLFNVGISPVGLMKPDPMVVATKLLARRNYKDTGKQFNMIAASWIQFMIHDWVDHLEDTNQVELIAPNEVADKCPLSSFKFFKTKEVPTGFYEMKTGTINTRTPWWDGSALYGSTMARLQKVRTFKDGKLKISEDGLLLHDQDGIAVTGDVRNSWAGVSLLEALFIKEHNSVCEAIKEENPHLSDEELYRFGRLVTSAVIAKVHTIDWTVELLKTDTLDAGMHANWYGLLGKKFKDTFGHVGGAILGGFVGMKRPEIHGVPYSLTEEFVDVYRMHSLLPDQLHLRDLTVPPGPNKSPRLAEKVDMANLIGLKGERTLSEIGFTRQMVSMGHQACGALVLWNYPRWLRNHVVQDMEGKERPDPVDLAALEVYRDRERKFARYNQLRRALLLIPISKWEDLTDDKEAIQALGEVHGDDRRKLRDFTISETAFAIFLLMASRYTKKGLEWVKKTESLKDVLDRHYPEITKKWMNSASAFSVWDSPRKAYNPIPLYLRVPK
ncbi:alpha-dioxygenase 1 [Citrus sinensis]|uniref:Alpha-dioxygenase 1 n=1 Tax=Citrus sinensis TaxID=2711 RepID=A0ACB8MXA3_CITSI|nr:alpha-dioxygenase 1 [Citrus sinensis]